MCVHTRKYSSNIVQNEFYKHVYWSTHINHCYTHATKIHTHVNIINFNSARVGLCLTTLFLNVGYLRKFYVLLSSTGYIDRA
jgi:hypothetical protein